MELNLEAHEVRRLGPSDDALLLAAFAIDPEARVTSEAKHRAAVLDDPDTVHLAALGAGHVVGHAFGYHLRRADRPMGMLLLCSLDVAAAHRRQGVARSLVQAFLAEGAELEASVWLATNAGNRAAMGLYASCGATRSAQDDVILSFEPGPRA